MNRFRFTIWALAFLCISQFAFAGGPWTPEKNTGLIIVNLSPNIYAYLADGERRPTRLNRAVYDTSLQGYFEYGVTDRFAVIANLPFKIIGTGPRILQDSDVSDTLEPAGWFGWGNTELELKYQFLRRKGWVAALSVKGSFLPSVQDSVRGIRTGYDGRSVASWLHIGKGFSERFYAQAGGGYEFRDNGYDEVVHLYLETGWRKKEKKVWYALLFQLRKSMGNATFQDPVAYENTGLYMAGEEYAALAVKWSAPLRIPWEPEMENWRIHASLGGGLAFTRWIAMTPAITLGVSYDLEGGDE